MACRSCTRSLVQFHWFIVQSRRARETFQKSTFSATSATFDSFSSVRTIINRQRSRNEKELLSAGNIVKDAPAEITVFDEMVEILEAPPEEPEVTAPKEPRRAPRRSRNAAQKKTTKTISTPEIKKKRPAPEEDPQMKTEPPSQIKSGPQYTPEEIAKRPAVCTECGIRFARQDFLVVHMRRHTGEKPYACRYCGKSFPRTTDLNVHERYHTNQKSHFCSVCDKGFNRPYNLKVHMRVHTKVRPYKCPECPMSFKQSNDLKTHIRRHTGERSTCDICGESFLLAHRLTQHKKTAHKLDIVSNIGRLEKYEA